MPVDQHHPYVVGSEMHLPTREKEENVFMTMIILIGCIVVALPILIACFVIDAKEHITEMFYGNGTKWDRE